MVHLSLVTFQVALDTVDPSPVTIQVNPPQFIHWFLLPGGGLPVYIETNYYIPSALNTLSPYPLLLLPPQHSDPRQGEGVDSLRRKLRNYGGV